MEEENNSPKKIIWPWVLMTAVVVGIILWLIFKDDNPDNEDKTKRKSGTGQVEPATKQIEAIRFCYYA